MQQTVLMLLKEALFNKICELPRGIDWDAVFNEANSQEILPLIYSVVKKKKLLSSEIDKAWQKRLTPRLAKSQGVFMTHAEITKLFETASIRFVTIKGVTSASYYDEPLTRIMGDTDVLVKKEDFDRASELLIKNGYACKGKNDDYHIEFSKMNMTVELHRCVKGIPEEGILKEQTELLFGDVFNEATDIDTVFGRVRIPSPFHHGLIMLLHMQAHLESVGMGLRHLCDWAVFINRFSDSEFRSMFEEKLKKIGLWRFARIISRTAEYIGAERKEWMGNKETELSLFVLNDILSCGNFGRKDDEKRIVLRIVPRTNEKRRGSIVQYFRYGMASIKRIWPFFDKYKIFMPVGFIAYCFRVLLRLLTGKSKIYNLNKGYKRRDLYKKMKWFETENGGEND